MYLVVDAIMEETSSGSYKPHVQEELLLCKVAAAAQHFWQAPPDKNLLRTFTFPSDLKKTH